jgi:hypothetical protein
MSDTDHPTIYLEPGDGDTSSVGRQWCQNDVWSDNPAYGGVAPTRYVRADLVEALRAELDQLRAERQKHDTPVREANERLNETVERLCEEIEALKTENARLHTVLRVTLLRHVPGVTHGEVDAMVEGGDG